MTAWKKQLDRLDFGGAPATNSGTSTSMPPEEPERNMPRSRASDESVESDQIIEEAVRIRKVNPSYPRRAMKAGIEGTVEVVFTIDSDGNVQDPVVTTVNPKGWEFEKAAIEALLQWRYEPKTISGLPVETLGVKTVFKFRLSFQ